MFTLLCLAWTFKPGNSSKIIITVLVLRSDLPGGYTSPCRSQAGASQSGRVSEPSVERCPGSHLQPIHTYRVRLLFQSLEAELPLLNRSARVWLTEPCSLAGDTRGVLAQASCRPCPGLPSGRQLSGVHVIQVFSSQQYLKGFLNIKL